MSKSGRRKKVLDGVELGSKVRVPETGKDLRFSSILRVEQVPVIIPAPHICSNFQEQLPISPENEQNSERFSPYNSSERIIAETIVRKPKPFAFKACELFLKTIIGKPC